MQKTKKQETHKQEINQQKAHQQKSDKQKTRQDTPKKTVLLGVTGCIAAYKSCEIIRALQKHDIDVHVVMSAHAQKFITYTTLRALTHHEVAEELFEKAQASVHHISLAQLADLVLIAPASANAIAKFACGIADDLLTTTVLATSAPLVVAPAMNAAMWNNPATQENIARLKNRGYFCVEPEYGYLACGDEGQGRLGSLESIVQTTLAVLNSHNSLKSPHKKLETFRIQKENTQQAETQQKPCHDMEGIRILITAGPTQEPIDTVRYLSNRSSGKMGYALAQAAQKRGAQVSLISGPVALAAPEGVRCYSVVRAQEMLKACQQEFPSADIALFAAAVADITPINPSPKKLKKGSDDAALQFLELQETPDILKLCARTKTNEQVVVGFAAETENTIASAQEKLLTKHADFMVANTVGPNLVFDQEISQASLVDGCSVNTLPLMSKRELADIILDKAVKLFNEKQQNKA